MRISGSYLLEAPGERVWPVIFDPRSLMNLIPGCQQLERVGENEYRGQIQIGVAAVRGVYETSVRVLEQSPLSRCRLEGEVSGPAGVIQGQASFVLKEVEDGKTQLDYEADATITGALAQLSPRFIEGLVRTLIRHGLTELNQQLRAQSAADTDGR